MIKKILKNRSKVLLALVGFECLLSTWALFYFNYMDRLNYDTASITATKDLALLIYDMYTSTWWALIILTICLATIFSLTALVYREVKPQFIAICLWVILFILAIDIKDSLGGFISILAIFAPIISLNIFGYLNQKKLAK